jgi:hypothetical protein
VQQIIYLDWNSSDEKDVAIRMYAKLKPIPIPNARAHMNVLRTGGLNSTGKIKSPFQTQQ